MDEAKSLAKRNRETLERLRRADTTERGLTDEQLSKARNLLKLRDVLKSADEVRCVFIDEVAGIAGGDEIPPYVEYCALNTGETIELSNIKNSDERLKRELFLRVKKADPEVTEDNIYGLPSYLIKLIMIKIREQEDYRFLLPALQRNLNTLRQIQTPNGSGDSVTDSTEPQPN